MLSLTLLKGDSVILISMRTAPNILKNVSIQWTRRANGWLFCVTFMLPRPDMPTEQVSCGRYRADFLLNALTLSPRNQTSCPVLSRLPTSCRQQGLHKKQEAALTSCHS